MIPTSLLLVQILAIFIFSHTLTITNSTPTPFCGHVLMRRRRGTLSYLGSIAIHTWHERLSSDFGFSVFLFSIIILLFIMARRRYI
jgi:hypothetical protein